MKQKRWLGPAVFVALVCMLMTFEVSAQTPRQHAVAMAETNTLFHPGVAASENVAHVGHFLPRVQALRVYSHSEQHRKNFWSAPVRMLLTSRVAHGSDGAYVTNRSRLFTR